MAIPKGDKEGLFTYRDYRTWPEDERWELIHGVAYNMSPAPARRHQGILAYLSHRFVSHFDQDPCSVYTAPFDVLLPELSQSTRPGRTAEQDAPATDQARMHGRAGRTSDRPGPDAWPSRSHQRPTRPGRTAEQDAPATDQARSKPEDECDTVVQPDLVVICDPAKLTRQGCTGAPDFVLEILSPATAFKDMEDKLQLYERHGVREYWIVNPGNDTLLVYSTVPEAETRRVYGKPVLYTVGDTVAPRIFPDLSIDLTRVLDRDR